MNIMAIDLDSLNFPVFNSPTPEPRPLTMDEFDAFITEDLQNAFDFDAYRKEKANRNINVFFTITD
jgi:hypothetical protein